MITGGAGFIGYHLARYLSLFDNQIVIADNFQKNNQDQDLMVLGSKYNLTTVNVDLKDPNQLDKIKGSYDYIYHLAAIVGVQNVLKNPWNVLDDGIAILENVINLAKAQKQLDRFIFASSSEVYDQTLKLNNNCIPTSESCPITVPDLRHSRATYMLAKIYGEALCVHSGLPYTIFRPFNIYGPRMGMAHVIPETIKKINMANDGGVIDVWNLNHSRTYCYIDDAVKMIKKCVEHKNAKNSVFNIGSSGPEITVIELVKIISKICHRNVVVNEVNIDDGSPARRCPDVSQINCLTGHKAIVSLEKGLQLTCNWYKKNRFYRCA